MALGSYYLEVSTPKVDAELTIGEHYRYNSLLVKCIILKIKNHSEVAKAVFIEVQPKDYNDMLCIIKVESNGDSLAYYLGNYGATQINNIHIKSYKNKDGFDKSRIYDMQYNIACGYKIYKACSKRNYQSRFILYNSSKYKYVYNQKIQSLLQRLKLSYENSKHIRVASRTF